jgi:hypothetical protein
VVDHSHDVLPVSPARLAVAEALRPLGHAVVAHQVDDALLGRIAEAVDVRFAESQGLCVAIPPERLGLPAESAGLKPVDLRKSPKSTS